MQQYQYFAIWLLAFGIIGAYSKGIQQPESQPDISELRTEQQESGRAQVFTKNILEDGAPIDEGVIVKRTRRNPHPGKVPDRMRDGRMQAQERATNRDEAELQVLQRLHGQMQQERQIQQQQQQQQQELQRQQRQQELQRQQQQDLQRQYQREELQRQQRQELPRGHQQQGIPRRHQQQEIPRRQQQQYRPQQRNNPRTRTVRTQYPQSNNKRRRY